MGREDQSMHLENLGHSDPKALRGGQVVCKRARAPAIPPENVGHQQHTARSGYTGSSSSRGGRRSDQVELSTIGEDDARAGARGRVVSGEIAGRVWRAAGGRGHVIVIRQQSEVAAGGVPACAGTDRTKRSLPAAAQ